MAISAIMFDFDGTLIDTMGAFADVAGRLMSACFGGTFEEGREAYLATSGIPFFQQLEVLHPGDLRNKRVAEQFESDKLEAYKERGLFPDVAAAVSGLRERGIATVVSSNNFSGVVRRFLDTQDVSFDVVLGFGDGMAKGERHIAWVERELGVTREEMLFVGDSVRDGELALAAGIRFVGRLGTVPEERFVKRFGKGAVPLVSKLTDVLALLDGEENNR